MPKMGEKILMELSLLLGIPLSSIDLNISFLQAGGNSLSAIELAAACQLQGIHLNVERVLLSSTIADLLGSSNQTGVSANAEHCHLSSTEPQALLGILDGMSDVTELSANPQATICKDPYTCRTTSTLIPSLADESFPITEMQLLLIHGNQKDPGTNIIEYHETYRPWDVPTMMTAWKMVIESEPIFRTEFALHENKGRLIERGVAPFSWTEITVSSQHDFDAHRQQKCLETSVGVSFKVITLRSHRQDECKSTIIWRIHHALVDGYSSSLLIRKVQLAVAGMPIYPGPSFARFSGELDALHRRSSEAARLFWEREQRKYGSAVGELLIPAPISSNGRNSKTTDTVILNLQMRNISAYCRRIGVTAASFHYTAWALVLSMFVDSETVTFGAVLSGRTLPLAGVESVIGPVINMLPFSVSLEKGSTAVGFLRHTFSHLVELTSFQCSRPEDGFNRKFCSALAVQYEAPKSEDACTTLLEKPFSRITSDVPLYVLVEADGVVSLNYHSDLYRKSHIENLGKIFLNAIFSLLEPHRTISTCLEKLLSSQVQSDLQRFGNCLSRSTTTPSIKGDLVTLFQQAAISFPDAIALEKGTTSVLYSELNDMTTWAASQISSLITPGEVVCVHADGSINWIVALYSVLKAGGVYCPFDETLPVEARELNFRAAGSKLYLVPDVASKAFQPGNCDLCISMEELVKPDPTQPLEALAEHQFAMPRANAYLCFTSGSTGRPKGVICRHNSVVAFQSDLTVRLFAGPGRRISQIMSPAFDGSIHEIFSALSYGATLVLGNSANRFEHLRKANSAVLTPSVANVLDPVDYPQLTAVRASYVPQHLFALLTSCRSTWWGNLFLRT